MSTWLDDVVKGLEKLDGIATLSDIYEVLREVRTGPHPKSFNEIVRRTLENNSSDSTAFKGKNDLFYSLDGIGSGVWGLRSALEDTPTASDVDLPTGFDEPKRQQQNIYRILRDTNLARKLKQLHENRCQLCGGFIRLPGGKGYSEAHHIKPLGKPHHGPDVGENIIVLCPNHHVMLDYGAMALDLKDIISHPKHIISEVYADYHNEHIYG